MESDTKRSSVLAGILGAKARDSAPDSVGEPREAGKEARAAIDTPMLDIAFADGDIESFSYAYLTRTRFTPGDTITLYFAEARVVIDGRNLLEMRERIRLHRQDRVQEGTEAEGDLKPPGAAHISRIDIESEGKEKEERTSENRRRSGFGRG